MTNTQSPAPGVAAEVEALEHYIKESDGITVGIPVELAHALVSSLDFELPQIDNDLVDKGLRRLMHVVQTLQETGSFVDDEGDDTSALADLGFELSKPRKLEPFCFYDQVALKDFESRGHMVVYQKRQGSGIPLYTAPPLPAQVRVDGLAELGLRVPLKVEGVTALENGGLGVVVELPKQIGEMKCWLNDCKTVEQCAESGCASRTPAPGMAGGVGALTDERIEAAASALVESCIAKGHWAHASDESKAIYRGHAKAVILAALPPPGRGMVPLTEEQIFDIANRTLPGKAHREIAIDSPEYAEALGIPPGTRWIVGELHPKHTQALARAIEKAHGITGGGIARDSGDTQGGPE